MIRDYKHGTQYDPQTGTTRFAVWAPKRQVRLALYDKATQPTFHDMQKDDAGFSQIALRIAPPGTLYKYEVDGELRPDPASRLQPEGVHGRSAVVNSEFDWRPDDWKGLAMKDHVIYELHVGTFSPTHDFSGVIQNLPHLKELGATAIEIMPVSQFPGDRNWGYDGAYLYAVQTSYGNPQQLKQLVQACHQNGLAVILDVVYNHFGPEGNYLHSYGPYFTDKYHTPWGKAINFDGPGSLWVRRFFLENAYYWLKEFHFDGLRLDAVHAILDESAIHILEEMQNVAKQVSEEQGRQIHLIAETDLNNPRIVAPVSKGGYGLSAQWSDDFHHAIHSKVTGEMTGYYADYGSSQDIAKVFRSGYVYDGQYSKFRDRQQGRSTDGLAPEKFVICSQNHDQIGNRMLGDRLASHLETSKLKLLAASVVLSPFTPLLFMGEEYAEDHPFMYFISHTDPDLVRAVQEGRKKEFATFGWKQEPPDPQSEQTFQKCVLDLEKKNKGRHKEIFEYYKELLKLRRHLQTQGFLNTCAIDSYTAGDLVVCIDDRQDGRHLGRFFNFSEKPMKLEVPKVLKDAKVLLQSDAELTSGELQLSGFGVLIISNLTIEDQQHG